MTRRSKMFHLKSCTEPFAKTMVRASALLIALCSLSNAATIVSVSGPNGGSYGIGVYPGISSALAVSWTSSNSYTNVSVSASLVAPAGDSNAEQGTAYLMTQIGPGTTAASEVAQSTFFFPTIASNVTLFSGLTLPANTYYLVIGGTGAGNWVSGCGVTCTPTVNLGSGVTENATDSASPQSAFVPASGFHTQLGINGGDPYLVYAVTTVIPEPATIALMVCAVLALGAMRYRRAA